MAAFLRLLSELGFRTVGQRPGNDPVGFALQIWPLGIGSINSCLLDIFYISLSLNPMDSIEKNLIQRIRKGDQQAFDRLFENNFESLCNYAFLIVRDEAVAEEVVSEAFYRLWSKRSEIRIRVSLKKYLFRSVYNISLNYLKHINVVKHYKDLTIILHKEKEIFADDYKNSPLAILEYAEVEALVNNAIENLPDQCRQVFTMNRFEGLKYHEIAQKLNISMSTVKYHMSTALDLLRNNLKGYY